MSRIGRVSTLPDVRALSWYVEFIVVAQRFNYGGFFPETHEYFYRYGRKASHILSLTLKVLSLGPSNRGSPHDAGDLYLCG